jgi:hypothetical protein
MADLKIKNPDKEILDLLKYYLNKKRGIVWGNDIDYKATTLCLRTDGLFFYQLYYLRLEKEKERYAQERVLEELQNCDCNCKFSNDGEKDIIILCYQCKRIKQLKEVKQ